MAPIMCQHPRLLIDSGLINASQGLWQPLANGSPNGTSFLHPVPHHRSYTPGHSLPQLPGSSRRPRDPVLANEMQTMKALKAQSGGHTGVGDDY